MYRRFTPVFRRFQSSVAYTGHVQALKADLKNAMLNKLTLEKNTIRAIISTVKNAEINGSAQNEFELYKTLSKMVKQRQASADEYSTQNRADLAEAELAEAAVIKKYLGLLPVASHEELTAKLTELVENLKAANLTAPMGKVFQLLTEETVLAWKASPALVKPLVPKVYKAVFEK